MMKTRRQHPRLVAILFWSILAVAPAPAKAETFRFEASRSVVAFKVRQFLGTVSGHFRQFSGTVLLNRAQPEKSEVRAAIQVKSIDTGIKKRDEHLSAPDFFDAARFPEITFASRRVKQTGPESAEIEGDLTMHGVTQPITLSVTIIGQKPDGAMRWRVKTKPLSRRAFGLRWSDAVEGVSMISDEVAIDLEIETTRVP